MQVPTPQEIRQARDEAGLTQGEAAQIVHVSRRTWQSWELAENHVPLGLWELFHIKTLMSRRGVAR